MRKAPRRPWLGAVAGGILLVGLMAAPERAQAGNVPTSIASSFELIPESHLIRVQAILTVTNQIPSTTSGYVTTNYYINTSEFAVDRPAPTTA